MDIGEGALVQLRAYIAQGEFATNDRLPPERRLCETLGVPRSELRKAFAVLEAEGTIWRHVGRGTFVGNGESAGEYPSISTIAKRTTPREVMYARLVLEPSLAREAALHATAEHVEKLHRISARSRHANTWREYEALDNQFHRLIAEATQITPLIAMFDQLNAVRRTVVWGRLRKRCDHPPRDHHSFAEHEEILDAIKNRDAQQSQSAMRRHLHSVTSSLFPA
ncbi:MAG: FadR family transcriptional regulator [Gammaproteobacteria bacterium]|nr:FadR family transcriptional regulator [Gammaproteobacteria bacterium]